MTATPINFPPVCSHCGQSTGEAALLEGFLSILIERETDYLPLIVQRIHRRLNPVEAIRQTGGDLGLFGEPT